MQLFPVEWAEVFASDTAILELIARGTVLYIGLLIFVRVMPRRTGGEISLMDLVFILLITEGASHSLGVYDSVADGFIVIATLMFWAYIVTVLSYYVPAIERLVAPPPIKVIHNGRLLRRNMRKEYLTEGELMSHLREEGIDKVEDVKSAAIEGDGRISVIPVSQ